ncbi:MAG: hypothetical protein ACUVRJ_06535 [Candidatus Villigracilaceae bacterium]
MNKWMVTLVLLLFVSGCGGVSSTPVAPAPAASAATAAPTQTSTPEPTSTPPPAPTATPTPSPGLTLRAEGEFLAVEFTYAGSKADYNAFQVFFDADPTREGYRVGGIGAEFLVENNKLFTYVGTGEWNWSVIDESVEHFNVEPLAFWKIPLEDFGDFQELRAVAQLVDPAWNSAYLSPIQVFGQ